MNTVDAFGRNCGLCNRFGEMLEGTIRLLTAEEQRVAFIEEDLMKGDVYHAKDSAYRVIQFLNREVEVEEDQEDGSTAVFTRNEATVRCLGPAMAQGLLDPDLGGPAQPQGENERDDDDTWKEVEAAEEEE